MSVRSLTKPGVLLLLVLAAPGSEAREKPLPPTRNCLDSRTVVDTRVIDDRTIDFIVQAEMRGRPERAYRNTLTQRCDDLAVDGSFAVSTPTSFYCTGNPLTVLIAGRAIPGSRCDLGTFVLQPPGR